MWGKFKQMLIGFQKKLEKSAQQTSQH